jgi:hypothetical protein
MDERIKELAEQAGFQEYFLGSGYIVRSTDLERFAELVRQDEREQAEKQEPVRWFQQYGDTPPRKEWVELNLDDIPDVFVGDISFCQGAKWALAKLRSKNGY